MTDIFEPNEKLIEVVKIHFSLNPNVTAEEIVDIERNSGSILIKTSVENALKIVKENRICSLDDVHNTFRKWFHIQDTNRIDVVLATALSRKMEGTPLWLIIVSNSGDMKSEQINALDDDGETTKVIHKFTDKTLVNGYKDKTMFPDLAPKLNGKIMLISDMAEILQLHPNVKGQVWSQLRDLYDGLAGVQTGMGTDVQYKNLRIGLIAGSTPAIDNQILIHQSLGTRELIYRPRQIVDVHALMEKVWKNEEFEHQMRAELRIACRNFLDGTDITKIEIPAYVQADIKRLAQWLCNMRASASVDSYTGELRGDVHPEKPTRVLKQFKRLYICLKSLDNNYSDDKALAIIKEVAESSADQIRVKILKTLQTDGWLTTSKIAEKLRIGKKAAKSELSVLWNLKLIQRRAEENTNNYGVTYIVKEEWAENEPSPVNIEDIIEDSPSLNNI